MPLQKLIGSIYSIIMEIVLWLIPIGGFITLGIIFGNDFSIGFAFLGILAGLILDVLLFGPIIILLNIRTSLINIEKNKS
jgi:hypothetical protein